MIAGLIIVEHMVDGGTTDVHTYILIKSTKLQCISMVSRIHYQLLR